MKNISTLVLKIISIVFAVVAIIMFAVAGIWGNFQKQIVSNSNLVKATITDVKSFSGDDGIEYNVSVKYQINGTKYESKLSEYSSSMHEGKQIELYSEIEQPENVHVKSLIYLGPIIFTILGFVFIIISMVLIVVLVNRKKKHKNLIKNGRKVYAQISGGIIDYSCRVNGRNPYRLNCETIDASGQVVICTSGHVLNTPESYIGKQVVVYIDKKDSSKYYVDLESIKRI